MKKEYKFWLCWLIQVFAVTYIFYWMLDPIYKITFQNGGRNIDFLGLMALTLMTLLPFWIIQIAISPLASRTNAFNTGLIWFGTYFVGAGPAIAWAYTITKKLHYNRLTKTLAFIAITAAIMFVFYFIVCLYAVTIGDLIVNNLISRRIANQFASIFLLKGL